MSKPVQSIAYDKFRRRLIEAREAAGLSQREVCRRLSQPATFMTKVESGYRRLDVVELVAVLGVLGADPVEFVRELMETP